MIKIKVIMLHSEALATLPMSQKSPYKLYPDSQTLHLLIAEQVLHFFYITYEHPKQLIIDSSLNVPVGQSATQFIPCL